MSLGALSILFEAAVFFGLPLWFGISQVRMMRRDREAREARRRAGDRPEA